jgi:adiponectin receptor
MGLSAVIPLLHGLLLFGPRALDATLSLRWVVCQGALYIAGAGIYAARVPERLAPGRFDVLGCSHQIFHGLVLLAAGVHLRGLVLAFRAKHTGPDAAARVFGGGIGRVKRRVE